MIDNLACPPFVLHADSMDKLVQLALAHIHPFLDGNGRRGRMLIDVADRTRSQYAPLAVEFLFKNPVFRASSFADLPDIPAPTARRILAQLNARGVFDTLRPARGRRPAIHAFRELLDIAEGGRCQVNAMPVHFVHAISVQILFAPVEYA